MRNEKISFLFFCFDNQYFMQIYPKKKKYQNVLACFIQKYQNDCSMFISNFASPKSVPKQFFQRERAATNRSYQSDNQYIRNVRRLVSGRG